MRTFLDLEVWRLAYELTRDVYKVVSAFPADERYGLTAQIRRAAVSIVANISEGAGRTTAGEQANSLSNASGSASELECLFMLAHDLGYVDPTMTADLIRRIQRIRRMLYGLIAAVRRGSKTLQAAR